jgi:hypothetical protein
MPSVCHIQVTTFRCVTHTTRCIKCATKYMAVHGHEYDDIIKVQNAFPDSSIEVNPHEHKHVFALSIYDTPRSVQHQLIEYSNEKGQEDFFLYESMCVSMGIPWCRSGKDGTTRRTWHKMILPTHVSFCAYEPHSAGEKAGNMQLVVGCCHCKKQDVKMKFCTGCVGTQYCSTECQAVAWPSHKKSCRLPNEFDQMIEILWELTGMHYGYGEYDLAQGAAEQIMVFSKGSMRWGRISQQERLAHLLEPYLSEGVIPQRMCK